MTGEPEPVESPQEPAYEYAVFCVCGLHVFTGTTDSARALCEEVNSTRFPGAHRYVVRRRPIPDSDPWEDVDV